MFGNGIDYDENEQENEFIRSSVRNRKDLDNEEKLLILSEAIWVYSKGKKDKESIDKLNKAMKIANEAIGERVWVSRFRASEYGYKDGYIAP